MSYIGSKDFLIEVAKGNIAGHSIIEKFGSAVVGTALTPVSVSTVYETPTSAVALEIVSSDANDTATEDARLIGIKLFFTTDAAEDT